MQEVPEVTGQLESLRYSVVIPTYNTNSIIMECLNSLAGQQDVDNSTFEVIIVNDGGQDVLPPSIRTLEDKIDIRYFSQDHRGPAAARNLGIERARGEIILLLDDDSLPTGNWMRSTQNAWENNPDAAGIGGVVISEESDSIYCRINTDFFNWYLRHNSNGENCSFLVTCNAGYRKDVLDDIGRFDTCFKRASGEDRDLNLKIMKKGGNLKLDDRIVVYHDRDLTFKSFLMKNYNYGVAAFNIYRKYPELRYLKSGSYFDFFVNIVKGYDTLLDKFKAFSLLTLSQSATAAGYFAAKYFDTRGHFSDD